MTAKEFLQSIRNEQNEINHLFEFVEELRTSLLPSAIRYDKLDIQTSLPEDPMAETYAKIDEIKRSIGERVSKLMEKYNKAMMMVVNLEKTEHRQIIQTYYLNSEHLNWNQVADHLGYSKQHTLRLHNDAIELLQKNFKDETKMRLE